MYNFSNPGRDQDCRSEIHLKARVQTSHTGRQAADAYPLSYTLPTGPLRMLWIVPNRSDLTLQDARESELRQAVQLLSLVLRTDSSILLHG